MYSLFAYWITRPVIDVYSVVSVCHACSTAVVPAVVFMAEGLLPVPEKLAQKIVRLEFVEMREMMPDCGWG